jgi:hypothetical protein
LSLGLVISMRLVPLLGPSVLGEVRLPRLSHRPPAFSARQGFIKPVRR